MDVSILAGDFSRNFERRSFCPRLIHGNGLSPKFRIYDYSPITQISRGRTLEDDKANLITLALDFIGPLLALYKISPVRHELLGVTLLKIIPNRAVNILRGMPKDIIKEFRPMLLPQIGNGAIGGAVKIQMDLAGILIT